MGNSIAFIVPYFGEWPIWFPAFLKSCESNHTIEWIFFTDCEIPSKHSGNVNFHKSSLMDIRQMCLNTMGIEVALENSRKLCDLKPAYGDIFSQYLREFNFWGFCDIDIIWGDIRSFITDKMLMDFDIITSLEFKISGHFTILRNTNKCKLIYRSKDIYITLYRQCKYAWFDESAFTEIIKVEVLNNNISVMWRSPLLKTGIESAAHQEYFLDKWVYKDGKILELVNGSAREYMYLHFINWKVTMKSCDVGYTSTDDKFYISYSGIHYKEHTEFQKKVNNFKNIFNGYWVKEGRRKRNMKLVSLKKRIQERINKTCLGF